MWQDHIKFSLKQVISSQPQELEKKQLHEFTSVKTVKIKLSRQASSIVIKETIK
jgi:23S rRNA U2552 (ribose-2'-O)-methylase RlmE/FtsJ